MPEMPPGARAIIIASGCSVVIAFLSFLSTIISPIVVGILEFIAIFLFTLVTTVVCTVHICKSLIRLADPIKQSESLQKLIL